MKIIKKIILMIVSVLVVLIVGEIILRAAGFSGEIFRRNEKTGLMTLIPNWEGYWTQDCFKNLVKTNSTGFYDEEFAKGKNNNVYRIAILGDSFVEALQVPINKTFGHILEERLNREFASSSRKFEVYSFGHSGNGTFLNYFYLKKYALEYGPDLVIDAFLVANDVSDDSYELSKERGLVTPKFFPKIDANGNWDIGYTENALQKKTDNKVGVFLKSMASRSALVMWLYPKYYLAKSRIMEKSAMQFRSATSSDYVAADYGVYLKNYNAAWDKAWKNEEVLLRNMNNLVKNSGAKFLLVSLAEDYRVNPEIFPVDYRNKYSFDFDKPEIILKGASERSDITYLPLLPEFKKRFTYDKKEIAFPCDGHWNEAGHLWAADAIFNFLKNNPQLTGIDSAAHN